MRGFFFSDVVGVQEALAGRRAGADRVLGGLEDRAASPNRANDVLEVSDAPGEARIWSPTFSSLGRGRFAQYLHFGKCAV
jgi:hypothetical protein